VSFGLDGVAFEIDLNGQHASELRAALESYVRAARRVSGRSSRSARPGRSAGNQNRNTAIRQWALDNGIELPGRGPDRPGRQGRVLRRRRARPVRGNRAGDGRVATRRPRSAHRTADRCDSPESSCSR
jgi:hypothetical protein